VQIETQKGMGQAGAEGRGSADRVKPGSVPLMALARQ